MRDPIVVSSFGEANHSFVHILFRHFTLAFAYQVQNPLMGFEVLVPDGSAAPVRVHAQPYKSKEWREYPLSVVEKMLVAREPA